jgi:hypothetical protein
MLGYQSENEAGNLKEFGVNPISNTLCAIVENFCPPIRVIIKSSTIRNEENFN